MIEVRRTADQLAELIDGLSFGVSKWEDVVTGVGESLPGSFVAVYNTDFSNDSRNSMIGHNMDDNFIESYQDHFAAINPWARFWTQAKSGTIAASEIDAPSAQYKNTEFYNDWLLPQNSTVAAAGIKVAADFGQTILVTHYPLRLAPEYDALAIRLLEHLRGNFNRAVEFARTRRMREELAAGNAALVARGTTAAFVVAEDCRLVTANRAAEHLFRSGTPLTATMGRIVIRHAAASLAFSQAVNRLCRGWPTDTSSISFEISETKWRLSIAAISPSFSALPFDAILPARRTVFVSLSELTPHSQGLDTTTLQSLYGLSRSEQALCVRLMMSENLDSAADHLGVTKETVRSHLKAIFNKTSVSRQSELMLLLAKLC